MELFYLHVILSKNKQIKQINLEEIYEERHFFT